MSKFGTESLQRVSLQEVQESGCFFFGSWATVENR